MLSRLRSLHHLCRGRVEENRECTCRALFSICLCNLTQNTAWYLSPQCIVTTHPHLSLQVRLGEQWPDPTSTPSGPATVSAKRPIKVFSELQIVKKHLTHSAFQIVDSEADADILWLCKHVKDFE